MLIDLAEKTTEDLDRVFWKNRCIQRRHKARKFDLSDQQIRSQRTCL